MTPVAIAIETPLQDDVRAMVTALNDALRPLSPPEFQFQLTVEDMDEPATTLFVARDGDGRPLGMGALKRHDASLGEVKRMFTDRRARGAGVGGAVLASIEARARHLGLERLALETGATSGYEPAWRIYERAGFRRCGAFLDYPDSGYSAFFEKKLVR